MSIAKGTVEKPCCSDPHPADRNLTRYLKLSPWLSVFLLSVITFPYQMRAMTGPQTSDIRPLITGAPIERELSSGQSHPYRIALGDGQIFKLEVEPQGIALLVEVFAPDGAKVMSGATLKLQAETVQLIAEKSGEYRVEIMAAERDAQAGRYKITLVEIRSADQRDKELLAAERMKEEGDQLQAQNTKEALQAALGKYEEALALYRAAGDRSREAYSLNDLALGYQKLGEMQKSLEFLKQVLLLDRASGDHRGEAYSLTNIGVAYTYLGQTEKAVESFVQALPLMQALGDKRGEGTLLLSLGNSYQTLGRLEQARECFTRGLPLLQAAGDQGAEGVMLNNLGALYRKLGNSSRALDYYQQALPLLRASGNRSVESTTLDNMGVLYREQSELPKALEYFNQALSLRQTLGNKRAEGVTLDNIGAVYRRMGDPRKALGYHQQALQLLQTAGDNLKAAVTLNNIGAAQRQIGDFSQALESYQQAWRLLQVAGDRLVQADTLRKRAEIERDLEKFAESRSSIEQAIALLEDVRASVDSEEDRASFFATVTDYYEFHTDLLMQLHRADPQAGHERTALHISEQSRARSLLELLGEAREGIREGVSPQLLERERNLHHRLTAAFDALNKTLGGRSAKEQREASEKEVYVLTGEYRKVLSEIRATSPRYAALTQPQPLTAEEIQKRALDDDTLLLEYALGERRSYLWVVSPSSISSYQLPPRAEIEALARKVYEQLIARLAKQGAPDSQFNSQASALSRTLLGPASSQLGAKRLVIVAPGALAYLPFAVLPVPSAGGQSDGFQPLISVHEVVNLPSASVLSVIRRETVGRQAAAKSVAVLADPVFDANDARVALARTKSAIKGTQTASAAAAPTAELPALTRSIQTMNLSNTRTGLTRLLFSREEAEAIYSLVSGGAGLKATDFKASRATATSDELSQYRIVHFATHGLLNSEHPELSGLALSLIDETGKPQDGFLRLHEIYNLKLNADLVVLSACQTGLGKEIKGEGLVGLTRGFMYAGAPRVVASLWRVDDAATAELMKRFYRGMLKDKLRPAAALRAAQLELMKRPAWRSPYFWGAFILQGEWN